MSNTPTHRTFSRNAVAAELEGRIRYFEAALDPTWAMAYPKEALKIKGALDECKRLDDHVELGKDRRRPQRGTLTSYDG